MASKSQIMSTIKDTLNHLRSLPDTFGYIAADVDTLKRAVAELRSLDSSRSAALEEMTAERDRLLEFKKAHDAEVADYKAQVREANKRAADAEEKARATTSLLAKIVCFHDNFRMDTLEKSLGEEYDSLRRKITATARNVAEALRKSKGKVDGQEIFQHFFRNLDAVQSCASRREDLIYEACRKTVVNFGVFLAAAIDQHGPITIDENTKLASLAFAVDGTFPHCTVRACTEEEEAAQVRGEGASFSQGIKELARKVMKEFNQQEGSK